MKTIPLSRGLVAIVDDDDYDWLSKWKWYAAEQPHTHYAARSTKVDGKKKTIWMHREINQTPVGLFVDHINGQGLDNRQSNLRTATHKENMVNCARWRIGTSRFRGVTWHKHNLRWQAQITVDGRNIYLGAFKTEEEARQVHDAKRRELRAGQIIREDAV